LTSTAMAIQMSRPEREGGAVERVGEPGFWSLVLLQYRRVKPKGATGLAFETWDPSNQFLLETPTLRLVIRSDCLNSQANGGAPLQVEAADSNLSCPPGRVPHVCAGVAGALHGLNKMGAKPLPMFSFPFTEAKQREEPNNRRAERCEADLSRLPRRAVGVPWRDLQFRGPL
jgi:hypothetical protein